MKGKIAFQSSLELSPECNVVRLDQRKHIGWFQSSLELSPECNLPSIFNSPGICMFQSSLELSPECNRVVENSGHAAIVSILTRAFARVQREKRWSEAR